ncbi:MAG: histidinol-phosphate transaminase [Clostridiaceae bacterium]|jgi:histidinol-phosphate aminotransferase|nr:histidinol-phosphate transaminase [Clostridiaceae bacterium]
MSRFWSKTTKCITPYVPGEQPRDKKYIKLNTNENPYPPSTRVYDAIRDANNSSIRLYPDPDATELKSALSAYYKVGADEVFVGNGSDEVLAFCFPAFFNREDAICFLDITYSFYPVYAEFFGVDYKTVSLRSDFTVPLDDFPECTRGIFLANPNAPTGIALDVTEIEALVERLPNTLIIVDEAYVDFGARSMVEITKKHDNLLVVQTFSKSRQMAGLRVGYAIGNTGLIEGLKRIKNSFNSYTLDRIAQKAAVAALEDDQYFIRTCEKIIKTREDAAKKLMELGFKVLPSKANFLFISHDKFSGKEIFSGLKREGILVRHFPRPRIDNWLRITIGTDEEMNILIEKLKDLML